MNELSGRELDVAVAQAIGWTNLALSDWDLDAVDPLDFGGKPPKGDCIYRVPRYSADWAAAMEAAEAMRLNGWDVSVFLFTESTSCSVTCCHGPCIRHGNTRHDWHGVEDVPGNGPEAVARAIVKAREKLW